MSSSGSRARDRRATSGRSASPCRVAELDRGRDVRRLDDPQGGKEARGARERQGGLRRHPAIEMKRLQRADRRTREVLRRVGQRHCRSGVRATASRAIRTGGAGSAASRSLASDRAAARRPLMQQRRRRLRIEQAASNSGVAVSIETKVSGSEPSIRTAGRCAARRSPARPRSARLKRQPRRSAAHGPTAAPSCGTAPARGGESTRSEASGETHIWSRRRPRSFLVQSGER